MYVHISWFKNILGAIKNWSFEAELNFIFVIDIPGWLSSGLFLSAALPVKEIRIRLFYRVVKKSRSTPAFQISVLDK